MNQKIHAKTPVRARNNSQWVVAAQVGCPAELKVFFALQDGYGMESIRGALTMWQTARFILMLGCGSQKNIYINMAPG